MYGLYQRYYSGLVKAGVRLITQFDSMGGTTWGLSEWQDQDPKTAAKLQVGISPTVCGTLCLLVSVSVRGTAWGLSELQDQDPKTAPKLQMKRNCYTVTRGKPLSTTWGSPLLLRAFIRGVGFACQCTFCRA
jgi:hypothetical protein